MMPRRLIFGLLVCSLSWASVSSAQEEFIAEKEWQSGFHGLAMICRSAGLEIHDDRSRWGRIPAEETLLIIIGRTDRLPINLQRYAVNGGAMIVATDRSDRGLFSSFGIRFVPGPWNVVRSRDAFQSYRDCPVVTNLDTAHPVLHDVDRVITNRPGALLPVLDRVNLIGRLPYVERTAGSQPPFIATYVKQQARALFIADDSVFSNQMIIHGDNARFCQQAIRWAQAEDRKHVLILVDQTTVEPANPDEVEILMPPPSRDEVLRALRNLPPAALVDFGNAIVTLAEDEGIFNEMITTVMRRLPRHIVNRVLLLLPTAALVLLLAYLLIRTGMRPDPVADGQRRRTRSRAIRRRRAAVERKHAAETIFEQFCLETAGSRSETWQEQWVGMQGRFRMAGIGSMRRQWKKTRRQLERRPAGYWTRRRLRRLESQISGWYGRCTEPLGSVQMAP